MYNNSPRGDKAGKERTAGGALHDKVFPTQLSRPFQQHATLGVAAKFGKVFSSGAK